MIAPLLLQLAVVLLAVALFAALAKRARQPRVVAEIAAGIALGPSVLGRLWPESQGFLFPHASLAPLHTVAQLGLVLYMFMVGLEFDGAQLRGRGHAAVAISHASIALPMALGIALALLLKPVFLPDGEFWPFALFMGAAMSITAFPVLSRILGERGLKTTPLGSMALAVAAVDDVTAWCLLAFVTALAGAHGWSAALRTTAAALVFVAFWVCALRPWLGRNAKRLFARGRADERTYTFSFLILCASALCSDMIGIHALFGAFLAGCAFPRRGRFHETLTRDLETVTHVLLLPLFFAYSGLRTRIDLLDSPALWLLAGAVLLVAVAGKCAGGAVAARLTGSSWGEALSLGILLNTRGLMELVALNVGMDLGVVPPALFTAMVLMALVTTAMTTPLLALVERQTCPCGATRPQDLEKAARY